MIILEKLGFIFYRKNQKLFVHLKASRLVWKVKQETPLKPSEQIVVENIAQPNLKFFVKIMAFEES